MKRIKIAGIWLVLFFLLVTVEVQGITRQESVLEFVDSARVSPSGYADQPDGELNIKSTYQAMLVKTVLDDRINNSLDILYFVQRLQNSSGGFSFVENGTPSVDATIFAVRSLDYLDVNQSQFSNWLIFPYLNSTISDQLFNTSTNQLYELNEYRLQLWNEFLEVSAKLGIFPSVPVLQLVDKVKALQYANGSYPSFGVATESVNLLVKLGELPNDADLASKFIQSFIISNGAFGLDEGSSSLEVTYRALLGLSNLMDVNRLETRTDITRFVFTQQHSRSGFSEVNSSVVTMESTFHAIIILSLLQDLDELIAPDVLQEVGFVVFPLNVVVGSFILVLFFRRLKFD